MSEAYECVEVRALLPELATGAMTGRERAEVLRHVEDCPSCRAELAELARLTDALLALAPRVEPPAGFESTVVSALALDRRPLARRRVLSLAATFLVAAGLGAGLVWWQTGPDRALAEQARQTQAGSDGWYLPAARITTADGTVVGTLFRYQGEPSWLLVTIAGAPVDGPYDVQISYRDGSSYPIGTCQVADRAGTTVYRINRPLSSIAVVRMTGPAGVQLTART
jgi:hypothetical protein